MVNRRNAGRALGVLLLALAGCGGGGGGGTGGGGAGSNGCPDDCLAGTWTLSSQVLVSGGLTCGLTGLESIEIQLSLLQSDATWSLYDLTSNDISMPSPGPTQSTLSFFVLQEPTHKPGFAGMFYVPSQNITVQLSTEAFSSFVVPSLSQAAFSTEVEFETYAGNAMVGTPQGGGITSWEIDPNATQLCGGTLRIDGQRNSAPLTSEPTVDDESRVLRGSWRVGERVGATASVRFSGDLAEVRLEETWGDLGQLAPRATLLAIDQCAGNGLRFANAERGATLRIGRNGDGPAWLGSLEFVDEEQGLTLGGALVLTESDLPGKERTRSDVVPAQSR